MKIRIQGQEAVKAAKKLVELLKNEGVEASYKEIEEIGIERGLRDNVMVTAAVVSILNGTISSVNIFHDWGKNLLDSQEQQSCPRVEKIQLDSPDYNSILFEKTMSPEKLEQLQEMVDNFNENQ